MPGQHAHQGSGLFADQTTCSGCPLDWPTSFVEIGNLIVINRRRLVGALLGTSRD